MHFALIKKYSRSVKIVCAILLLFVVLDLIFPLPKLKSFSTEIHANDGTLLSAYLTDDDKWRLKTNLEEVSPQLIKAVIEKEDNWFYWHTGINPVAVLRALFTNIVSSEKVLGASTITMQVARLLEPKDRTYRNKFAEMFRALQLEVRYSKKEILEIYLSILPFGGNIEGVKSASYIYFNRPPDKLSLAQSVLLAVIPNDPNSYRLDRKNEDVIKFRNEWINKFKVENVFSSNELNDAIDEPVPVSRYAMPHLAPHFCDYLKMHNKKEKINSSLDMLTQQTAENILLNHVRRTFYKGITNGAVIVIDNKNSSVVAYCGSSDFYDNESSGQVNGIVAVRSPGSTLKPALYAMLFDEGTLTPQSRLADIPTDFGGYSPENFDLKFYGNVTAQFALVNSLNIPAVSLLQKEGANSFVNFLADAGFEEISESRKKLGLSLILGGCGVTLEELAHLYSAFGRKGRLYPLNYFSENEDESSYKEIFSEESSYLIANILSGMNRSDVVDISGYSKLPKFAWKTGTSYGKRDAWAIGFNPDYTIGVWMGNFNGVGSPYLTGAEAAVPLLFDLFDAIDYDSDVKWFEVPEGLYKRNVCKESGLLPTQYCKEIVTDYAIKDRSNNETCNIHQPVYVSNNESVQYCTECLPSNNYKKVVYEVFQPELTTWLSQHENNFRSPPPHDPDCQARFTSGGPKILSPAEDYEYLVEKNSSEELLLLAASDSRVKTHYWFVNDMFYKKCKPDERIFFKPEEKNLKITCLDDKGRDRSVKISVKYY